MMASNRSSFSVSLPISVTADPKNRRSCLWTLPTASLFLIVFFIGGLFVATDLKEKVNKFGPVVQRITRWGMVDNMLIAEPFTCENQCRPQGSEALPEGIVVRTSNLKLLPLWGSPKKRNSLHSMSLLAIAVGIRQKENVDKMVQKFPSSDFVVMLFHYDGIVDKWSDLEWSPHAIHVSAIDQTKWWFAKRFLHPDIVSEYDYIFLWDEDLGVENFNPGRYLSIVKEEGLEISQPALDIAKSEVHHQITARGRRSKVHRRTYKRGAGGCDANSTAPPCTGYVEMMAPVFSRASWRCTWYMIQNDLIHGWGLDFQLGYCAQGDRTKNIGVVDAEYIIHQGLPTLGGSEEITTTAEAPGPASSTELLPNIEPQAASHSHVNMDRYSVRKQSYIELERFKKRWEKAVQEDKCWVDPFQQIAKQ